MKIVKKMLSPTLLRTQKCLNFQSNALKILLRNFHLPNSQKYQIKFETRQIFKPNLILTILNFWRLCEVKFSFKGGQGGLNCEVAPANPPFIIPQSPDNAFKVA